MITVTLEITFKRTILLMTVVIDVLIRQPRAASKYLDNVATEIKKNWRNKKNFTRANNSYCISDFFFVVVAAASPWCNHFLLSCLAVLECGHIFGVNAYFYEVYLYMFLPKTYTTFTHFVLDLIGIQGVNLVWNIFLEIDSYLFGACLLTRVSQKINTLFCKNFVNQFVLNIFVQGSIG